MLYYCVFSCHFEFSNFIYQTWKIYHKRVYRTTYLFFKPEKVMNNFFKGFLLKKNYTENLFCDVCLLLMINNVYIIFGLNCKIPSVGKEILPSELNPFLFDINCNFFHKTSHIFFSAHVLSFQPNES